jgi:TPR repeat protein
LSQSGSNRSAWPELPLSSELGGSPDDFVLCQRAAEAGLPAAQLALAQMYLTRKTGPQDLVHAYMWYLIAMERASQAKGVIAKVMTAAQIDEARRGASAWLSRLERTPLAALQGRPGSQLSTTAEGHLKSFD